MIAEITLICWGFTTARHLANKLVTVFEAAQTTLQASVAMNQWSKPPFLQNQYHFSLRHIKVVLEDAGKQRLQHVQMNEQEVILRSICNVTNSKLRSEDLVAFKIIVEDVFPDVKSQENFDRDEVGSINFASH